MTILNNDINTLKFKLQRDHVDLFHSVCILTEIQNKTKNTTTKKDTQQQIQKYDSKIKNTRVKPKAQYQDQKYNT